MPLGVEQPGTLVAHVPCSQPVKEQLINMRHNDNILMISIKKSTTVVEPRTVVTTTSLAHASVSVKFEIPHPPQHLQTAPSSPVATQ